MSIIKGNGEEYDEKLAQATTTSFVIALDIDIRDIDECMFLIHNSAAGDLTYDILGTIKYPNTQVTPTGTDDDNKGWKSLNSGTVASGGVPLVFALTNPYSRIVILIKHVTTTTNVDVYYRGINYDAER